MATSTLLTSIDAQITAVMANPEKYVDYTVGNKTFKRGQYLDWLKAMRESLVKADSAEADFEVMQFDHDISQSGEDNTQYVTL